MQAIRYVDKAESAAEKRFGKVQNSRVRYLIFI